MLGGREKTRGADRIDIVSRDEIPKRKRVKRLMCLQDLGYGSHRVKGDSKIRRMPKKFIVNLVM